MSGDVFAIIIAAVVGGILLLGAVTVRAERRRTGATGSAFSTIDGAVHFHTSSHGHDCGPGHSGGSCDAGGGADGGGGVH